MFTQVRDQVDRERADSEQLRHRLLPVPAASELPGRAAHRLQTALDRHAFTRFSTISTIFELFNPMPVGTRNLRLYLFTCFH